MEEYIKLISGLPTIAKPIAPTKVDMKVAKKREV